MENAPVIGMGLVRIAPGVDEEVYKRYRKWATEVYQPMSMKFPGITEIDQYEIARKSIQYPSTGAIYHIENIVALESGAKTPERQAIEEDINTWVKRGVAEYIWRAVYGLVQGFRSEAALPGKKGTTIENAPIMHLEAYRMTPEEQEKFNKWFNEYGGKVFVPLFMKTCGLKGYDYFKFIRVLPTPLETDYPPYLSILYFENLEAFENFEQSPEQESFQSALRNILPLGLNYRWYVQYKLVGSLRK